jgi:hypothetical protein
MPQSFGLPPARSFGPFKLKVSRFLSTLTHHTPPNRVHFWGLISLMRYGLVFRFLLLPTVGLLRRSYFPLQAWLTWA